MNGTLVIAARELRASTRIFAICAALAVLPFLASLLPGARGNRTDVIAVFGGFLSIAVGLGLAVALGVSTVGRELSERRMSFYFTKPVAPAAIWFGKAAAALAISLGCFALIAVPAYLASPRSWRVQWLGDAEPLAVGALAIVELFLVSHLLSTVLRSRSAWIALDAACFFAGLAGLYLIVRPLLLGGAVGMAKTIAIGVAIAASAIIAVAPAWQLARGRTEVRSNHAALSRFLWPALAAVLLVAAGYGAWVVSVSPGDLAVNYVEQAPRGNGVLLGGHGSGRGEYVSTFLIDRETGAYRRLAGEPHFRVGGQTIHQSVRPWWGWGARFSNDGERVVWLQPRMLPSGGLELYTARTRGGNIVATGLNAEPDAWTALSDDGTRVAIAGDRTVSVFDLASGKLLASGGGLEPNARSGMFFVTPDVVRIIDCVSGVLRIYELDVRARSMRKTGEHLAKGSQSRLSVSVSGDGTRIFLRGGNVILDGRTAQPIARVQLDAAPAHRALLYDGTLVAAKWGAGNAAAHLQTFTRDGQPLHHVVVPAVQYLFVAGEVEGGKLILIGTGAPNDRTGPGRNMFVFDVKRGVIERTMRGISGPILWGYDTRVTLYAADTQFVAVDIHGKLVTWDPRTGVVRRMKGT